MSNTNLGFVGADFMQKVATDDAFRRQLELDPMKALTSAGYSVSSADLPSQVLLPTTSVMASDEAGTSSESGGLEEGVWWAGFIG